MSTFAFCDADGKINVSQTYDDPARRTAIGVYYLTAGVIGIPICAFNLTVFCRRQNIQQSCYKLLVISVALDLINLLNGAIIAGLLTLFNATPCNGHWWTVWFGREHIVFWYAYSATSIVLALNRMLIFASKRLSQLLFDGARCWLWLLAIIGYTVALVCIDLNVDFVYDPNAGTIFDTTVNLVHVANNFVKLGFVTFLYLLMLTFIFIQIKKSGKKVDKAQIKISLMTLSIAALADFGSAAFLAASYLPQDTALGRNSGIIGESSWFILHTGTGIIYMFCNKAVLDRLKLFLCCRRAKHSEVSIVASTRTVQVNNLVRP